MSLDHCRTRAQEMVETIEREGGRDFTTEEAVEFDNLTERIEELTELETRIARTSAKAPLNVTPSNSVRVEGAEFNIGTRRDPWGEGRAATAQEARGQALTAIERMSEAGDDVKEAATAALDRVGVGADHTAGNTDVRGVAEHITRYSSPLYVSAFRKYARDPEGGYVADLTPDEARVWRSAREEARATLATTGAVLPTQLDPSIVILNAGAQGSLRSVARVDTTSANSKRYISSAGSTFSFDAELAEVSDDTPTLTEIELTPAKAQGWIEASIETWADQPDFSGEALRIIADSKARLEAAQFVTGSGTNAPTGIETALTGGASEVDAAGEALVADDVYGLIEALPARYRESASWQLELSTRNFIHRLHSPSGSEPPMVEGNQLVGSPYNLNSSMDPYSGVDAAATATHRVAIIGDWQHFVILDRVGMSVSFIPPGVLTNTANNRPDGRVGWFCFWRTTSGVLGIDPFRMLKITTTA